MHKDFKTGLAVGAGMLVIAMAWLCTLPKLSVAGRSYLVSPNTEAVSQVTTKMSSTPNVERRTPSVEQTARFHIVQKGDTLSAISQKYYGTPLYRQKILAANDAALKDPDRLVPGTRLVIPE